MRQLADQMHRSVEREHAMMTMVADGQRASTRPAPRLLDGQFKTCEHRVFRPAVWHDGLLLIQDVLRNHTTIDRPTCVFSFLSDRCSKMRDEAAGQSSRVHARL